MPFVCSSSLPTCLDAGDLDGPTNMDQDSKTLHRYQSGVKCFALDVIKIEGRISVWQFRPRREVLLGQDAQRSFTGRSSFIT